MLDFSTAQEWRNVRLKAVAVLTREIADVLTNSAAPSTAGVVTGLSTVLNWWDVSQTLVDVVTPP